MQKRHILCLLAVLLLAACRNQWLKQYEQPERLVVERATPQTASDSLVNIYRQQLNREMSDVIASSGHALLREGDQSPLGNFVCDALKYAAAKTFPENATNLVLVNRGGLRNNLPKGNITVGNVFELMPFENLMVMLSVKGKVLQKGLSTIVQKRHAYAGLQITVKGNTVVNCLVNGETIDPDKNYTIVTSDYLANAGDNFDFLQERNWLHSSEVKIRDAIIAYCRQLTQENKTIEPYTDDRLIDTN